MVVAWCAWMAACAGPIVRPLTLPSPTQRDALLVLPGFGYTRAGERALRALAPKMAADHIDLYVPTFIARAGLDESRARLATFVRERQLTRYERVHVFAFLAGAWAFNPLVERDVLPNLATVIYDRSPYQERAPQVARDRLRFLAWLRYGPVLFDLARSPWVPLSPSRAKVALIVETEPTRFITRYASTAARYGPYRFECGAFDQAHADCLYIAMDHHQLYTRFEELWPEVRAFIRQGRFSATANRAPPRIDAGAVRRN